MSLVVGGETIDLGSEEINTDTQGSIESDLSSVTDSVVENELLVEETSISDSGIELYDIGGTAYDGSISTTYLAYFAGIADKLTYDQHYVLWRPDRYNYTFAYGSDIILDGSNFSGDCEYVNIYVYDETTITTGSDTLALSSSTGFVYSDLGMFPEISTGGSGLEYKTLLFILAFFVCYNVLHDIFDYALGLFKR